jgi:xanthine dehydrogenase accessory factor
VKELLATIDAWRTEGQHIARGVVVRTFGSAPRPPGATLLRSADGRIAGSVSGGCVESATARHAEEAAATGVSRVIRFGISDEQAWDVGLACGGTIDVLVEPFLRDVVVAAARGAQARQRGGRAVVTRLPPGSPGAELTRSTTGPGAVPEPALVVHADGRLEGSLGSPEADAELVRLALTALERGVSGTAEVATRQSFIEVFPVRPRLVIVGAVPVAMALVRLARELGYETVVLDARASFATRERFPDADELIVGWPDEVFAEIGLAGNDTVAVLSHDPKLDEPAIAGALRHGCRYVGAIGSRRTQQMRRAGLRQRGLSEAQLERLHGPIGLDLGGREPVETALAIMAEVVAVRHGASGSPLRDSVARRVSGSRARALDSESTHNRS